MPDAATAKRRGQPGMPPAKRSEIIAALKRNPRPTAVAREIGGVSHVAVWQIARTEALPLASNRLSRRKRAQIVAALKANPRPAKVARQIGGVSHSMVWKIAKAEGIPLAQSRRRSRKQRPDIEKRELF